MRRGEESPRIHSGGDCEASAAGANTLKNKQSARRWLISGRVQGVGFRWFVQEQAQAIGLAGWARNLDDGRVEAYASGTAAQLDRLAARLHQGPPQADVRGVDQQEAEMQQLDSFRIR